MQTYASLIPANLDKDSRKSSVTSMRLKGDQLKIVGLQCIYSFTHMRFLYILLLFHQEVDGSWFSLQKIF